MYKVEQINGNIIKLTSCDLSPYSTKETVFYMDLKNQLESAGATYYKGEPPKGYKEPHKDRNVCTYAMDNASLEWAIKHYLPKIKEPYGFIKGLI